MNIFKYKISLPITNITNSINRNDLVRLLAMMEQVCENNIPFFLSYVHWSVHDFWQCWLCLWVLVFVLQSNFISSQFLFNQFYHI